MAIPDPNSEAALSMARERIAGVAGLRLEPGNGGLPRLVVATADAQGELYLNGAHLTHWQPRGQQAVLFMSAQSQFKAGKAIRGGVPICFPWFGPRADMPALPQHGFARTRSWTLDEARSTADGVQVDLSMRPDDETRAVWPHDFVARYRVVIGAKLQMRLEVTNATDEAFSYDDALHTYFSVGDIRKVAVHGLANTEYLDKTADGARRRQADPIVRIAGEVDRLYFDTQTECVIDDPACTGGPRRIRVAKTGSNSTVVWNPDAAKARAMSDLGDDEWVKMACVETANAGPNAIKLAAGASHATTAIVSVER